MKLRKIDRAIRNTVLICGIWALLAVTGCTPLRDGLNKGIRRHFDPAFRNELKKNLRALRGHPNPAKLDTGLPVIIINTHTDRPVTSKKLYITADIEISDPNDSGNNFKGEAEIRGRGNTTWNAPKKPYRLRFPKKTPLFGYEKARSWVLLANYQDTTLITNTIAFELGRRFGLAFTPHAVHVEVILNGSYEGSYVLTEQIQTGPGRVDISGDESFLVELDNHYDEEPKFKTPLLGLPVMIKHPEDLTEDSGYDFVREAVNDLEAALFSESFPDTGYQDLIDVDNFIDYIMVNEITRNIDLQFPHSVFLYRDQGSKICLGPLWDFDYGFDYSEGKYFEHTEGLYRNTVFRGGPGQKFFSRFFEDPAFKSAYKERWNTIYPELTGMETFIDQMAARLEKSHKSNDAVWWWNRVNYPKEIARLKEWWVKRIAFLHREINTFRDTQPGGPECP
jgi:spore coat protein CotH